jgi:hypothetical protein
MSLGFQSVENAPLRLVQSMDGQTTIAQPVPQAPLFTLCLPSSTRNPGSPPRQADLPALEQGYDHLSAGRQMAPMRLGHRLAQPVVQGIVEEEVFFTAFTVLSGISA